MKRKFILYLIVISAISAISAITAFNLNIISYDNRMADISLENVEALAQESQGPECVPSRGYCIINEITIYYITLH